MKYVIITLCFFILPRAYSQSIIVENIRTRLLHLGVENYVDFNVDGYSCSDVRIKCTNATIKVDSCSLKIIPKEAGPLRLLFYKIGENDSLFLGAKGYCVDKLRNPKPMLFRKTSGTFPKDLIWKGHLELENIEYDKVGCGIILPIKKFKVLVIRNNEMIGYVFNNGQRFSEDAEKLLQSLRSGDEVFFIDIIGMNYYKEFVKMESLKFKII